jgi:hypothetical protein
LEASVEKTEKEEVPPLATAQSEPAEAAAKKLRLLSLLSGIVFFLLCC